MILFEIWPKLKIFKCWQNFEKDQFWPNVGKCSLPIMELCLKKSKTLALERSSFESAIVRIPNSMFSRHIFYTCKLNLPFIIEFENFYLELFSIWSHIYYCFLKLLVHQGECNNNEI